ncbi:DUF4365 domain-containing protein [Streptomyces sp. NPDC102340]|uniref:DUF4365 domain-containing protein n=1 Tax=unclassified Streptomyces TaxID=2593676 RepID=UPI003816F486
MTNRPVQHRIASLAVASVRREWNLQGHAVDEIHEDYGEDLMVQICFEGRLDPARVWVQVKGTDRDYSKALPVVSVKARQVLRWARTADLVVVVLWNVRENRGWFTLPQDQFDHVDLRSDSSGADTRLRFSREFAFDQAAVEKLAWAARIEHANRSIVYARACLAEAIEMDLDENRNFYKGVLASLDFDFGISIKAVSPGGGFMKDFPLVVWDHLKVQSFEDLEMATSKAMMMAFFEMIEKNCAGNGAPLPLVKELCATFHPLLFDERMMQVLEEARRIDPRRSER